MHRAEPIDKGSRGGPPPIYRIDLTCQHAGFSKPPFDIHLKVLPGPANGGGWTLLAHTSPGKTDVVARWLAEQVRMDDVRIAPGIAPRVFRATLPVLPPAWSTVASGLKVHHLHLAADGLAAWFVEGTPDQILVLQQRLELTGATGSQATKVHCRLAMADGPTAPLSRRQMETLSTAVALGYYDIPHRTDLRTLATAAGVSLGSVSELLRRAEAKILTHYVDSTLMGWPLAEEDELRAFRPLANVLRP